MKQNSARSKRFFALLLALALLTALASGCAGSSNASADTTVAYTKDHGESFDYVSAEAAPEVPMPAAPVESPQTSAGGALTGVKEVNAPDYGGHKVIRTIAVRFETNVFDDDYQALLDRANTLGGYVETSSVEGRKPETYRDSGRYAYLTFRIPSDKVDSFATNAKTLGTLLYYNENAEDITDSYFDSQTRLEVLNIQLERLKSILTASSELSDIIELEREIADVTLQIEELTSELRRYDGLIGYSTVNVEIQELSLTAGPTPEKTTGERINEGFTQTLYDVATFFVDFAVWFVSALPVLVILGIIALIVVLIVRAGNKKSKQRMAQAAAKRAKQPQQDLANAPDSKVKTKTPAPFPGDENNDQGDK